ncbi:CYTH domain-containing protein [candidate division KSB1 bacterium]|nr:CYTH domain-containing protein [candidate division KSB1 bacterium]
MVTANMAENIEIKAEIQDLSGLEERVALLSTQPVIPLVQEDWFFYSKTGRLKLRRINKEKSELIYYERPDIAGPKTSEYLIVPVDNAAGLKTILTQTNGLRGVVEKTRHLYWVDQTRIHLDRVKDLGTFVEFEVVLKAGQPREEGKALLDRLLNRLNIADLHFIEQAYIDLLLNKKP